MRPIAEIENVSKRFSRDAGRAWLRMARDVARELGGKSTDSVALAHGEFWALRDVSFEIERGEVLGLIGHNGAGKSTLIDLVAGVLRPTAGCITVDADRVIVMDYKAGMNDLQTGRENIANQLALYGVARDEVREATDWVVQFSELNHVIEAPVGTYSTGMRARLSLSLVSWIEPELLIVDEALGGGDIRFRTRFREYLHEHVSAGRSILLASHNTNAIQALCDRAILLHKGELIATGDSATVVATYLAAMEDEEAQSARRESPYRRAGWTRRGATPDSGVQIETVVVEPLASGGFEVCVSCSARDAFDAVRCTVEIGLGEITPLAVAYSDEGNADLKLRAGLNELRCTIDELPLTPGRYELYITVIDVGTGQRLARRGYEDAPPVFAVEVEAYPSGRRRGIVRMRASWDCTPDHVHAATPDDVTRE